ncbi:lysosomal-associated transmembrane protein 4B-like [Dendronephthya gigantea]|uniref:lysosomal-associated transmembrane protein 4B-like n=1 Tax=Dendronephthya gigantea TaxID=151771 RepID=UPI00106C668E|nr:lysosomal-associated transmembrane protein 4B-like [Dendronephthya gigantea]
MGKQQHRKCEECEHSYMNRCCMCLDIRTGVIILGLIHLVFQVAAIVVICQVLVHPDTYDKESPYISSNHIMKGSNFATLAISLLLFILTALMIYGTIQRRPCYMLPFFCIQVFDLCVCVLLLFGAVTNHDQVVVWRSRVSHHYRYMRLDKVDQRCLIATFTAFLIIKAYLANCVWTCYKLLVIRLKKLSGDEVVRSCCNESDFEPLLPNYDDATKETPKESPPPYANN